MNSGSLVTILVVHISDLHFRVSANPHQGRALAIAAATKTISRDVEAIFIVVSGDIAFSGTQGEYEIAGHFLADLQQAINEQCQPSAVRLVLVPGNHDCNFEKDSKARQLIVANLATNPYAEIDQSIVMQCTSVQEEYFEFLSKFSENSEATPFDRLCVTRRYEVDGVDIVFHCYNTAWVSQRKERQGQLSYPLETCPDQNDESALTVSVFHHPYGWLQVENSRAFRKTIERTSDLILTGHEHDFAAYSKNQATGETNQYLEGSVFQEPSMPSISAFNAAILDLENGSLLIYQFILNDDRYVALDDEPPSLPFTRNHYRLKNQFQLSVAAQDYLDDPGANFTHSQKSALTLSDIYVYPDFEEVTIGSDSESGAEVIIRGENYFDYLSRYKKIIVTATEEGGKTAFARIVFRDLQNKGLVPLLLNGREISVFKGRKLSSMIRRAFSKQYNKELYQPFLQRSSDSKALIIDDFEKTTLNWRGRRELLRSLERDFDYVLLVGSEFIRYQEILDPGSEDNPILEYKQIRMLEFGHVLRERLIEKWFSIGREYTGDPHDLDYKIINTAQIVESLVGRDLLPSCPIYVLIVVQQIEANLPLTTASGAYGYFYELLITRALTRDIRYLDLDTKYNFLSNLGWRLFSQSISKLTEGELRKIYKQYCIDYKIQFSFDMLVDDLAGSGVLKLVEGHYVFKYRYMLYYFIARYMRDNIVEDKIKDQIVESINHLYRESHANIVIFLTYLSKDPFIIDQALSKAKSLFTAEPPCRFEEDVSFVNDLVEKVPGVILIDQSHKTTRTQHLEQRDKAKRRHKEASKEEFRSEEDDDESFKKLMEINGAYKTIEVLGQILKNFPGSLKGPLKLRMAEECYLLGLRTVSFTYLLVEKHLHEFVEYLSAFWRKKGKQADHERLTKAAKAAVYGFCGLVGVAGILRVSTSLGSSMLEETYDEVRDKYDTNAVRLVDLAIRLDHFRAFPENDVELLTKRLSKNGFAYTLLRFLVARRLYLFPSKPEAKQRICQKVGIELKKKDLLLPKMSSEKKGHTKQR